MRVAFSGSRVFDDRDLVERAVDRIIDAGHKINIPCSGQGRCTQGVDTWVHEYVEHRADDVRDYEVYYAEWDRYGKRAGFMRNELMIYESDMLIAFVMNVESPGTWDAIRRAQEKGIPMHVYMDGKWTSLKE